MNSEFIDLETISAFEACYQVKNLHTDHFSSMVRWSHTVRCFITEKLISTVLNMFREIYRRCPYFVCCCHFLLLLPPVVPGVRPRGGGRARLLLQVTRGHPLARGRVLEAPRGQEDPSHRGWGRRRGGRGRASTREGAGERESGILNSDDLTSGGRENLTSGNILWNFARNCDGNLHNLVFVEEILTGSSRWSKISASSHHPCQADQDQSRWTSSSCT